MFRISAARNGRHGSPECGWTPFVEWMREQGLDPSLVYAIDIESAASATVHEYATRDGAKYLNDAKDDLVRREPRPVEISSLPPLRSPDA